jgi:hypothetical protein
MGLLVVYIYNLGVTIPEEYLGLLQFDLPLRKQNCIVPAVLPTFVIHCFLLSDLVVHIYLLDTVNPFYLVDVILYLNVL